MVGGLFNVGSLDSAGLQAGVDTQRDVVGDLLFETGDLDDSEATKSGADDVRRETEDWLIHVHALANNIQEPKQ